MTEAGISDGVGVVGTSVSASIQQSCAGEIWMPLLVGGLYLLGECAQDMAAILVSANKAYSLCTDILLLAFCDSLCLRCDTRH